MPREAHTCTPGEECFFCSRPDCDYSDKRNPKEIAMKKVGRRDGVRAVNNNGNYSPVHGSVKNDEEVLHGKMKIIKADKAEIEKMLVAQYGRKLEPITGSRRRQAPRAT